MGHTLTATEPTFGVAGVKGHSLVIMYNSDCVIGLKKPLNLEKNWRRPKPNHQAKKRPGSESNQG